MSPNCQVGVPHIIMPLIVCYSFPLFSHQALILLLTPRPGSNSTATTGPGATTADIVGWVVFSLSTFLAIVTTVIVVAVVACLKRRNRKITTGEFSVLNSIALDLQWKPLLVFL